VLAILIVTLQVEMRSIFVPTHSILEAKFAVGIIVATLLLDDDEQINIKPKKCTFDACFLYENTYN